MADQQLPRQLAVIGLGYVGLPLAAAFGRVLPTIGFDVDPERVPDLQDGWDRNNDVGEDAIRGADLRVTDQQGDVSVADCFVVTVPTPVDLANRPDLSALAGC